MTDVQYRLSSGTLLSEHLRKNGQSSSDDEKTEKTAINPDEEHDSSSDEGESHPSQSTDGQLIDTSVKRVRKKVQRLSETINRDHLEKTEQRAKAAKEISASFEAGRGIELGLIPLIESSFRKTKPIIMKPLHLMVYGRLGAAYEVRSNLRKFRGFGFDTASPEYAKKLSHIQQRPTNEIRDALRLLHLETSGTRQIMASRLMDFLMEPAAIKVKYKGKLIKKLSKGHSKAAVDDKSKIRGSRKSSEKSASSDTGKSNLSRTDEGMSDTEDFISSPDDEEGSTNSASKNVKKKRGRPAKKVNGVNRAAKRHISAVAQSDSDTEDKRPSRASAKRMKVKIPTSESDEDAPLSSLTSTKGPIPPSDQELKDSIIALLKTVNLEETSLKVVREKIFARYAGMDLTDKKEYINTTVKEYLAQS